MRTEEWQGWADVGRIASWRVPSDTKRNEDALGQESCDSASFKWRRIRIAKTHRHTLVYGLHVCIEKRLINENLGGGGCISAWGHSFTSFESEQGFNRCFRYSRYN